MANRYSTTDYMDYFRFSPGVTLLKTIECRKASWGENTGNVILRATSLPTTTFTWTVGNFVPGYAPNPLAVGGDYYLLVIVTVVNPGNTSVRAIDRSDAPFSIVPELPKPLKMPNAIKIP